jgi:uncharacterized protein YjbJ (UPF0337 family)
MAGNDCQAAAFIMHGEGRSNHLEDNLMDKNRIDGAAKEIKGATKEAFGKVTGNTGKQVSGLAEKKVGTVQRKVGETADKGRAEAKH